MLIQCQSCNTKYRLNLDSIPKRKTFVRCKHCGTPIYIDPTEEEAPGLGVIPPQPAATEARGGGEAEGVQVVCPQCDARYRVSGASLERQGITLKCTRCGTQFPPPAVGEAAPEATPQFYPPPSDDVTVEAPSQDMPVPDQSRMDRIFDDLRPDHDALEAELPPSGPGDAIPPDHELGALEAASFDHEPPVPDAEQAYLDAVSFEEGEGPGTIPGGTVPDDQKYRFFLNPKEITPSGETPMQNDDDALPPLGDEATESPPEAGPGDLPPLPAGQEEAQDDSANVRERREQVPGQEPRVLTERKVLMMLAAASLLVLVFAGGWGWYLASTSTGESPFTVQVGQAHQLALQENLRGYFIKNKPTGKSLFVVNGEVENLFGGADRIRWIRIKGSVFAKTGASAPTALAYAYAGNRLEDAKLAAWDLEAIQAYYGYTNGRDNLNYEIPSGTKVPYQLVFPGISGKVRRTVAEVVSYHRGGQAVFIDNP